MPVLKTNKNGEWVDIATSHSHAHKMSDITDLPDNFIDEFTALKHMVGTDSVASQIATVKPIVLNQAEYDKLVDDDEVQENALYMIVSGNA